MRQRIFRALAGLLALLLLWACWNDRNLPLRDAVSHGIIAAVFILYAIFGEHPAIYRLLGATGNPKAKPHIVTNHSGVEFRGPDASVIWRVEWSDVIEIAAWKVDAVTYDIITLGFRTSLDGELLTCDEEQEGYKELEAQLKQRFAIDPAKVFQQVAFPAFAANPTVLWDPIAGSRFPV